MLKGNQFLKTRQLFLNLLYEHGAISSIAAMKRSDIQAAIGLSDQEFESLYENLVNARLVRGSVTRFPTVSGSYIYQGKFEVWLTDAGLAQVAERGHTRTLEVSPIRVLFLAANPSDTAQLRSDTESRAIDQALRQAEFRDKFDIKQHWAVRVSDIQGLLLRHKPDIVHFSGHGSETNEIVLEDDTGRSSPVSGNVLSRLFSLLKGNIRCVFLNACYSERQAEAIAQQIDCVIGMSGSIGDLAATSFSAAFYQALGYGESVRAAFDLGCLQIDLENLGEQNVPKLLAVKGNPEKLVFVRRD